MPAPSVRRVSLATLLSLLSLGPARAVTLATWNAEQTSVESVTQRELTLGKLSDALRANAGGALPDVLVLQEVTSYAAAWRIARAFGYGNATVATSDSGNDRHLAFRA